MADEHNGEAEDRETVKLMGVCEVDSGMIMVVDPGRVLRDTRFEERDRERNKTPQEMPTYDDLLEALGFDWKQYVQRLAGRQQGIQKEPRPFVEYARGVVFDTQLGDLPYPVYAIYNSQGDLLRVEIHIRQMWEDDDGEDSLEETARDNEG